jgi:rod shape-determining protein MreD
MIAGVLLIIAATLAQAAVVPEFSIFGVQPNLLIVILVAWMTVRGKQEALPLIVIAGFLQGLLDSEPLGLAMLALAPLVLMTEVREWKLVESDLLPALLLTVLATWAYEGIMLLSLAVTGERVDWLASLFDVLLPAAVANALLLLPIYGAMRFFRQEPLPSPAFGA